MNIIVEMELENVYAIIRVTLTCGLIHTIGFRLDSVFGFGGKSRSSCSPPDPRVMQPFNGRPLFGIVPFVSGSFDRGLS